MDMFWSLAGEVGKLFLMMLIGFVVYRLGIITVEESKILSKMMLYIDDAVHRVASGRAAFVHGRVHAG